MDNRKAYIIYIINCIVFIALEAVALTMVSRSSVVQRSEFMKAASAVSNTLSGATGSVTGYFSLGRVNDRLAQENAALRIENDRLRTALEQTVGVDSLLAGDSLLFDYIPASVVSNSTDRLHNIIIINKGTRDGVKVSSVLDIDNMVSAIHRKTNTFGVLQWNGEHAGEIILHDIPVHTEIDEGDTVVSSGYSLIYPEGLPVGTVSGKELRDGINYDVTVTLYENFSKLRHVYVAVRKDIDQLLELTGGTDEGGDRR